MTLPVEAAREEKLLPMVALPGRVLQIDDFRKLERGDVVRVYYWTVNQGDMLYRFDHIGPDPNDPQASERVFGQLHDTRHIGAAARGAPELFVEMEKKFGDKAVWGEVDGYLYEFGGNVCRGSGAEPVHGEMPSEVFLECL